MAAPTVVFYGGEEGTVFAPPKAIDEMMADSGALQESFSRFVAVEKTPVVYQYSKDTLSAILNPYVGQACVLLGAGKDLQTKFAQLASDFRGDLVFVNGAGSTVEDRFRNYIGAKKAESDPQFVIYTSKPERNKYPTFDLGDGVDQQAAAIESQIKAFLAGGLSPYFKSEEPAVPAGAGEVAVVVGKTFDSIVKDSTKSVFLKVYAPWCGHCKKLAPVWDQLAAHYEEQEDVVLAKLDYTANEHKDLQISGFPTLLFYGKDDTKSEDYNGARTFDAIKEFIDGH
jgi:protein disulfide-isomerase A1